MKKYTVLIFVILTITGLYVAWADNAKIYVQTESGYVKSYVQYSAYLTTRNAVIGTSVDVNTVNGQLGQLNGSSSYQVFRAFYQFPIPVVSTVSACSLYVDGNTNGSDDDFNINIFSARAARPTLTTADFINFDGWSVSGAYTGTILNNTWNTSSYVPHSTTPVGNIIVFNAAGLDSIVACKGDTLWIVVMSAEDVASSVPGTNRNEYVSFGASVDTDVAYLSMTYSSGYSKTVMGVPTPAKPLYGIDKTGVTKVFGVP